MHDLILDSDILWNLTKNEIDSQRWLNDGLLWDWYTIDQLLTVILEINTSLVFYY